ncbi:MAG: hypothetical protein DMG56_08755, partial [Acidobacteria bacterium]
MVAASIARQIFVPTLKNTLLGNKKGRPLKGRPCGTEGTGELVNLVHAAHAAGAGGPGSGGLLVIFL